MGPHSFEQGNTTTSVMRHKQKKLQWGLTHSSKETSRYHQSLTTKNSFNGASLIRARKQVTTAIRSHYRNSLLQWGLTHSSKETPILRALHPDAQGASMGPHSFEQGNFIHRDETRHNHGSFNGASLIRARKPFCGSILS